MSSTPSTSEVVPSEAIHLTKGQILVSDIGEGPEVAFQCATHQWYFDNVNDDHDEDICHVFNCTPVELVGRAMSMTVYIDDAFVLRFAGQMPTGWVVPEVV